MKRLVFLVLILFMLILLSACGGEAVSSLSSTPVPTYIEDEAEDIISQIMIGFSIGGEDAFYEQLKLDIEKECVSMNYEAQIKVAASVQQQQEDIAAMLSDGAAVIVIDPVSVDALETVLAECETQGVPVINILDQINGHVNMLISANYGDIGAAAGRYATSLFGGEGGGCMMLKTDYDSFVMQWMSDGFVSEIDKDRDVSLVSEYFCGDDEEMAYAKTKETLKGDDVQFLFAQSPALARGAARAVEESGKEIVLVVCGAEMDIIESVEAGPIYAAIFFGPGELAQKMVYYADKLIKDNTYEPPQFTELAAEAVKKENAAEYLSEGALYAQVSEQ